MRKIEFDSFVRDLAHIVNVIKKDEIAVYSAQASFFLIISAVPLLSLLIAVAGLVLPTETIAPELREFPSVPLLSFSAITTLWSAAKGFGALRRGIDRVYQSGSEKGYFRRKLQALANTLVFIILITAVAAFLLFGGYFFRLPFLSNITVIKVLRLPIFALLLLAGFTSLYYAAAKGSYVVPHKIKAQLPGAAFASFGWILFSEGYSLYLRCFPGASYIFGSLAALCLIMLWLWFCISILIIGAELNKLISLKFKS